MLDIEKERDCFEKLLDSVGQNVTVKIKLNDGYHEQQIKAIITPLRYKNKMYLEGILDKIGYIDERHYLYIGPARMNFKGMSLDTSVKTDDGKYTIKTAEPVWIGDKILYVWAVLQRLHEGDEPWTL